MSSVETYIQDIYLHDDASTDKSNNYTKTNSLVVTHMDDHYVLNSSGMNQILSICEIDHDCTFEVTMKQLDTNGGIAFGVDNSAFTVLLYNENSSFQFLNFFSDYGDRIDGGSRLGDSTNYYTWKLERIGDTISASFISENGNILWSNSCEHASKTPFANIFIQGSNKTIHIKEIKIKTL